MRMYLKQDRIIPFGEATVDPQDRGYYFGDGIYEVFRLYGGRIFEGEAHMARLVRSARELRIPLPFEPERIAGLLEELLAAEPVGDGTLYLQITRGAAARAHAFPPEGTPSVMTGYTNAMERPQEKMERGIRLAAVPDIRWLRCDIKTLNLLANVLAKQEASDKGADEAVLHRDGIVTECSSSNIMIVKDGIIRTHPANNLILHGITRAVVLQLAEENGLPLAEEAYTLHDLLEAEEVFITGTTTEVTPVVMVDRTPIAGGTPGPVTRRLQQAFAARIGR
ncbi:D-amino-acid transaminase [Gorillibacterium sp. sgz5001074]|uniref:D-amino-acid transaminase n=1 Tax=Gorillibacterium sp. sgz5001074 TaxID=3446695 RepID=UPI003F6713A6